MTPETPPTYLTAMSESHTPTRTWEKIELYIISLWLFFFLIIVIKLDIPIYFGPDSYFIGFKALFSKNLIPLCSTFFLCVGLLFYTRLKYKFSGGLRNPVRITQVENVDYEHLTFLTTYIIPLICFDLSKTRYLIVMLILLAIIGAIYVRTNMFYANPSLALLGYRIYKANGNFTGSAHENNILISKEKLTELDEVQYIRLDEKIFYVRKAR